MSWRMILGWFAGAVAVAAAIYVVFWPLTDLIASHDVGALSGADRAAALQSARDAARGRLIGFGAGLFAAGALVYTARNFSLSREGQVTDRYTKAVEQIGSKELDVRIGGIYALERIAHDSRRDHSTVMEVLTTFVREHSRQPLAPSADGPATDPPKRLTRGDVQAAVRVIGRRNPRYDPPDVKVKIRRRLTFTFRPRLDLTFQTSMNLSGSDLTGLDLAHAHLARVTLAEAILADAFLPGADLTEAIFSDANLTGAILIGARLHEARFDDASLIGADFSRADLTRADLATANLTGAHFFLADLTGAIWPQDAEVPAQWERDNDSGRLRRGHH